MLEHGPSSLSAGPVPIDPSGRRRRPRRCALLNACLQAFWSCCRHMLYSPPPPGPASPAGVAALRGADRTAEVAPALTPANDGARLPGRQPRVPAGYSTCRSSTTDDGDLVGAQIETEPRLCSTAGGVSSGLNVQAVLRHLHPRTRHWASYECGDRRAIEMNHTYLVDHVAGQRGSSRPAMTRHWCSRVSRRR